MRKCPQFKVDDEVSGKVSNHGYLEPGEELRRHRVKLEESVQLPAESNQHGTAQKTEVEQAVVAKE